MQGHQIRLNELKVTSAGFKLKEDLFELEISKFKELNDIQVDIRRLTILWDYIEKVYSAYEKWNRILWKNIKTDILLQENEKFIQNLKTLPREVKNLPGFAILLEKMGNIKKAINCIDLLSSEAMQQRHWDQVSQEIGSQVDTKSSQFSFRDIVLLNIQKYEQQIQEISDNANKELKMGRDLEKINDVWSRLSFDFEVFDQAGGQINILKGFDEIQEILDNDNSKILGLLSQGKSVDFFRESIGKIKSSLNKVDSVISIFQKVQKNWRRLVNIFLLSEDIRNQLQEATKTFDDRNAQFREILLQIQQIPKVIDACTDERKIELDEIFRSIEECEKKLNLYLEEKKKIFA